MINYYALLRRDFAPYYITFVVLLSFEANLVIGETPSVIHIQWTDVCDFHCTHVFCVVQHRIEINLSMV